MISESNYIISVNIISIGKQVMYGWSMTSQDVFCTIKEIYKGEELGINDTISFKQILNYSESTSPTVKNPITTTSEGIIFLSEKNALNGKYEIEGFPDYKFIEYPSYNLIGTGIYLIENFSAIELRQIMENE